MTGPYVIRWTCSEGTRRSYWAGICPVAGIPAWTGAPRAAVKFARLHDAAAFRKACFQAGHGAAHQYEVVTIDEVEGRA